MRKALLGIGLVAIIAAGCEDKIKKLLTFTKEIEYKGGVDVQGVPGLPDTVTALPAGGVNADFPKVSNATNSKQYIEEYNTSSDKISTVIVSKLALEMSVPTDANFNYIDSVRVYVSAIGIEERLLGYKYDIPKDSKSLDLKREDLDLKPYFLADSIYFRINAHFIDIPKDSSKMDIKSTFSLVATPLN